MLTPLTLGAVSAVLIAIGLGLVLRDMWRSKSPKPQVFEPLRPKPAATVDSATSPARHPTTVRSMEDAPDASADRTGIVNTGRPTSGRLVTTRALTTRSDGNASVDDASDAAVTIVHRTAPPPARSLRTGIETVPRPTSIVPGESPAFDLLQSAIEAIGSETATDDGHAGSEGQRWPNVEKRWLAVAVELDNAVTEVNGVLAGVELQIGPAGESGWSFKNRGYGAFRRVLLNGRSIAWLRSELTNTGQLVFRTRSHAVEQALLNATSAVRAEGATMRAFLDGLSKTIRPAAEYAAWNKPRQAAEAEASLDGWAEVATIATQALSIAATAFREAGADIVEVSAPSWDAVASRHRWPLSMKVGGNTIGRVNIDLVRRALEVSVDEPDRLDLARRQAIDTLGLTPHALAEVIANCAWPTVAQALQQTDANALGYAG